jgi:hypothetical protein
MNAEQQAPSPARQRLANRYDLSLPVNQLSEAISATG